MISAFSGRHARWCPQIQRICRHWQVSCFTVKRRSSITICSARAIMSPDRLVRGRVSFVFFTRRSSFFELSYPRTQICHVHNAIIACRTQLLMNFDGFYATRVEDSDNHALFQSTCLAFRSSAHETDNPRRNRQTFPLRSVGGKAKF